MIAMKTEKRRNKILSILRAMQKEVRVEELAAMLDVSPLTVRRDLEQLSKDRTIIRTHGGCLAVGRAALETEYHKKVALNFELKNAIGRAASEEVRKGHALLINDGSTTFHLASHLGGIGPLSVYTNSLAMISELSRFSEIRLYIIGGEYMSEHYSLRGSFAETMLEKLSFDLVFLGADAIDDAGHCLVGTPEEARFTQIMLSRGRRKILLADHTKVGRSAHMPYGALSDFDMWITTKGIAHSLLVRFAKQTSIRELG